MVGPGGCRASAPWPWCCAPGWAGSGSASYDARPAPQHPGRRLRERLSPPSPHAAGPAPHGASRSASTTSGSCWAWAAMAGRFRSRLCRARAALGSCPGPPPRPPRWSRAGRPALQPLHVPTQLTRARGLHPLLPALVALLLELLVLLPDGGGHGPQRRDGVRGLAVGVRERGTQPRVLLRHRGLLAVVGRRASPGGQPKPCWLVSSMWLPARVLSTAFAEAQHRVGGGQARR